MLLETRDMRSRKDLGDELEGRQAKVEGYVEVESVRSLLLNYHDRFYFRFVYGNAKLICPLLSFLPLSALDREN